MRSFVILCFVILFFVGSVFGMFMVGTAGASTNTGNACDDRLDRQTERLVKAEESQADSLKEIVRLLRKMEKKVKK